MSDLRVNYPSLDRLFAAMNQIDEGGSLINTYVGAHVCNAGGFGHTAMGPIAQALPVISEAFGDGMGTFHSKWGRIEQAMYGLAKDMKKHDQDISADLQHYAGAGGKCFVKPEDPHFLMAFNFEAIHPALADPEPGADQLQHPAEFKKVGELWDTSRNKVNEIVDKINGFGLIELPRLTEQSLQEMLVFPLAGNYKMIGADANACLVVDKAMGVWGSNFSRLATRTPLAITGASGAALAAEFAAYGQIMKAVGTAVGQGAKVFNAVAKVAERIAVAIEKGLVLLGEKLAHLVVWITEHTRPMLGWLKTGWDAVSKNIHMFDKAIEDIKFVIEVIDRVSSLKSSIEEWAKGAQEDLKSFKEITAAMAKLPSATLGGHTSTTHHDSAKLTKTLAEINVGIDRTEDTSDLNEVLDDAGTPPGQAPDNPLVDGNLHSGGPDPHAGPTPAGAPAGSMVT